MTYEHKVVVSCQNILFFLTREGFMIQKTFFFLTREGFMIQKTFFLTREGLMIKYLFIKGKFRVI